MISGFNVSLFSHFHDCFPQIISFQHSHKCSWHVLKSFGDIFMVLDLALYQNKYNRLISYSKFIRDIMGHSELKSWPCAL